MSPVMTMLRRLARLKRLRVMKAPAVLIAAESALLEQSAQQLTGDELLQVAEQFVVYWEQEKAKW